MSLRLEILVWLGIGVVFGRFRMPQDAPVERLAATLEANARARPNDPKGHYQLARLHYMAFALRSKSIAHYPDPELPTIANRHHPGKAVGPVAGNIGDAEALRHLTIARSEISIAIKLEPASALHHLTAACIYEDGSEWARRVDSSATKADWIELAITGYKRAFDLAVREDARLEHQPVSGFESLVSYEAGGSYARLVQARGVMPQEKDAVSKAAAHVAKMRQLPFGAITPVVFSFDRSAGSLHDLIDPDVRTRFDLDGTGRELSWPWVRGETGILVWDPNRTGTITSGRQLFGSVTWWMFWESGYHALAALDSDRDGWLRGSELSGLAVWFDRNQNGRTDPGEVVPVEDTPIVAIRVRADGRDGDSWISSRGLELRDGSWLPTWDWVTAAIPAQDLTPSFRKNVIIGHQLLKPD